MSTAETTTVVTGDLVAKARIVHERLAALYDAPIPFFSTKDPLSELVSAILSHRTRNHDSGCVYKALRAALPTWEAVRDAPTAEVEAAIDGVQRLVTIWSRLPAGSKLDVSWPLDLTTLASE